MVMFLTEEKALSCTAWLSVPKQARWQSREIV